MAVSIGRSWGAQAELTGLTAPLFGILLPHEQYGNHSRRRTGDVYKRQVDMRTRQEQFGIDAKTRDNVTVTMAIAAQYLSLIHI